MRLKVTFLLAITFILSFFHTSFASTIDLTPYQSFFTAKHKASFLSKLFAKEKTYSELIITQKLNKALIKEINSNIEAEKDKLKELYGDGTDEYEDAVFYDKYDLVVSPEWDHTTNYVKIVIFKTPSSFFSSAKDLKPVRYGLADNDDKIVCEPENSGIYELTDEDIAYLKRVYGVEVDQKNRDAFISYYQPACMIDTRLKKRLIAFQDKDKIEVSILKYNRDFYNTIIRKDYNWIDEAIEEL